jgi:hypothetical protein
MIACKFFIGAMLTASARNPSKLTMMTRWTLIEGGVTVGVSVMVGVKAGVSVGVGVNVAVGGLVGVGVSAGDRNGKLLSIGI